MNRKRFLLISAFVNLTISLATTLASYYHCYKDPHILDASFTYRGWPLYWLIESISFWSPPPYPVTLEFKPTNFFIDFIFYAIVFQLPSIILILIREAKINSTESTKL